VAGELFLRRCYSTQGAGGSHDSHPGRVGLLLLVAASVISSPSSSSKQFFPGFNSIKGKGVSN